MIRIIIMLPLLGLLLIGCNVTPTTYEDTLSHEEKEDLGIGESKIGGGKGIFND